MNKKVLILGGAGFIGSHLCDILIEKNNLLVVDDLSLGRMENINHLLNHENFEFFNIDINSPNFEEIFIKNKVSTIYHLAANSDIAISHANPSIDFSKTFMTTFNTLEMMRYILKNFSRT